MGSHSSFIFGGSKRLQLFMRHYRAARRSSASRPRSACILNGFDVLHNFGDRGARFSANATTKALIVAFLASRGQRLPAAAVVRSFPLQRGVFLGRSARLGGSGSLAQSWRRWMGARRGVRRPAARSPPSPAWRFPRTVSAAGRSVERARSWRRWMGERRGERRPAARRPNLRAWRLPRTGSAAGRSGLMEQSWRRWTGAGRGGHRPAARRAGSPAWRFPRTVSATGRSETTPRFRLRMNGWLCRSTGVKAVTSASHLRSSQAK